MNLIKDWEFDLVREVGDLVIDLDAEMFGIFYLFQLQGRSIGSCALTEGSYRDAEIG